MIGTPLITGYGSSYGKYNGARLGDYVQPEPKGTKLNNLDETEATEFKDFDQTIKDYVKARLGHPVVNVELTDFQIKTCIEEAISKLEYHSPQWTTQYAVFNTSANINIYELPPEIVNNLTDVWYRSAMFSLLGYPVGSFESDLAIMFFTNTGLFNNYNVSQYVIMQMYLKQIRKYMGQDTSWNIINNKYLQIYPVPTGCEPLIVEFRGLDADTIHPYYKVWIQKYSTALAKKLLGNIRSKFAQLPGPSGGSKLNGEILLMEAAEEIQKLEDDLISEIENPPLFTVG